MSMSTKNELIQHIIHLSQLANTQAVEFQAKIAANLHIHITDLKALLILAYESPLAASGLVKKLKITPGAVTGVVNRLEKAGLAKRIIDPLDKRKVSITLDEKGTQHVKAVYDKIGQETIALLDTYSTAELEVLISYFQSSLILIQNQESDHTMKKD